MLKPIGGCVVNANVMVVADDGDLVSARLNRNARDDRRALTIVVLERLNDVATPIQWTVIAAGRPRHQP